MIVLKLLRSSLACFTLRPITTSGLPSKNVYDPAYHYDVNDEQDIFQLPSQFIDQEGDYSSHYDSNQAASGSSGPFKSYTDSNPGSKDPVLESWDDMIESLIGEPCDMVLNESAPQETEFFSQQIARILDRLAQSWPTDINNAVLEAHISRVRAWLNSHRQIVRRLLDDDQATWKSITRMCRPEAETGDKTKRKYRKIIHMTNPIWLAKPILSTRKAYIVNRLREYWGCKSDMNVSTRLLKYAEAFGVIQSPEPLLEPDHDRFKIAADAIYWPGGHHSIKHLNASPNDLLHQYSETYSVASEDGTVTHIPKPQTSTRVTAYRYHSGQKWLEHMEYKDIAKIQNAIKAHWERGLASRYAFDRFLLVNEFLEHDTERLEQIKRGDKEAAAFVAARTRTKADYQKYQSGRFEVGQ